MAGLKTTGKWAKNLFLGLKSPYLVCPQPGQGRKHHPEARMGLIRLILTKIHPPERFEPLHGGPEGVEGPKLGFFY